MLDNWFEVSNWRVMSDVFMIFFKRYAKVTHFFVIDFYGKQIFYFSTGEFNTTFLFFTVYLSRFNFISGEKALNLV